MTRRVSTFISVFHSDLESKGREGISTYLGPHQGHAYTLARTANKRGEEAKVVAALRTMHHTWYFRSPTH